MEVRTAELTRLNCMLLAQFSIGKELQFSLPPAEIILRGTVVYLAVFILLRLVRKREAGTLGLTDLLVIVLLGDASQSAMAGDSKTISDGLLLVLTIVSWAYVIDWLGFRVPLLRRFMLPPPLLLVRDGELQLRNMRRELVSKEELLSEIRLQGIEDVSKVKRAYLEGSGRISVVADESQASGSRETKAF